MDYSRSIVYDTSSNSSYSLSIGDIDGNGSMDIVVANSRKPNMVFLNFEKGTSWKDQILRNQDLATYDIILADLNNDNKLDIIESNSDAINYYYINRMSNKKVED